MAANQSAPLLRLYNVQIGTAKQKTVYQIPALDTMTAFSWALRKLRYAPDPQTPRSVVVKPCPKTMKMSSESDVLGSTQNANIVYPAGFSDLQKAS